MYVLVTGAAGFLGSVVCRHLQNNGYEVQGVDLRAPEADTASFVQADLRDWEALYPLVKSCDAVVHLANHTGDAGGTRPQQLYAANTTMNANVFQAAVESGVKMLIYASSTRIFSGDRHGDEPHRPSVLPYLPLDENLPPCPASAYAASKEAGEALLRYHSRLDDTLSCTTVRWPLIVTGEKVEYFRERMPAEGPDPNNLLDVGFSFLEVRDAAALVRAILDAQTPGYRQYFPAAEENRLGWPVERVRETFYPDVPLRIPAGDFNQLVDLTAITDALDWRPVNSQLT